MKRLLVTCALTLALPMLAFGGPKEDAFQVVEQFKQAFESADVEGVVKLFAQDAVFLGTCKPKAGDEDRGY